MKNKNATIKEVFTFLIIAILIGLIFLFAIKTIPELLKSSCEADEVIFRKDLNSFIEKYDDSGSIHIESMRLPCNYNSLCFIDKDVIGLDTFGGDVNPMIKQSIENNISYNVFLINSGIAQPIAYSEKIKVVDPPGFMCFDSIGGKVKIKFSGKGRTIEIGNVSGI